MAQATLMFAGNDAGSQTNGNSHEAQSRSSGFRRDAGRSRRCKRSADDTIEPERRLRHSVLGRKHKQHQESGPRLDGFRQRKQRQHRRLDAVRLGWKHRRFRGQFLQLIDQHRYERSDPSARHAELLIELQFAAMGETRAAPKGAAFRLCAWRLAAARYVRAQTSSSVHPNSANSVARSGASPAEKNSSSCGGGMSVPLNIACA
jgi:hypothetical protein